MTLYQGLLLGAVSLGLGIQLFTALYLYFNRPAQLTIYPRDSDLPASGSGSYGAELPLGDTSEQSPAAVFDQEMLPRSETARHSRTPPVPTKRGDAALLVLFENETDINNRDRILAQIDHLDSVIRMGTVAVQKLREAYPKPNSIPPHQPVGVKDPERQTHRSDSQSQHVSPIHNEPSCSCQDGAACPRD